MEREEYLNELKSLIGGEIGGERGTVSGAPRLLAVYRGYSVKVDVVSNSDVILEVNTRTPHHLRIRKEGFVSRALDAVGIAIDAKIDDAEFDDTYRIDLATDEQVRSFLTPEVRALLKKLEPFALFRMTHLEYRCHRQVGELQHYPPQQAVNDLDTLIQIAEIAGPTDSS